MAPHSPVGARNLSQEVPIRLKYNTPLASALICRGEIADRAHGDTPTKLVKRPPYESRKPYESRIRWFPGFAHDRYPAPRSVTVGGKGSVPQFMVPASHVRVVRRGCAYGLPDID